MPTQIRPATAVEDFDALFRLRYQVYVEEEGRFRPGAFPDRRIMDRFDTFDDSVNLLACWQGTPAGFIRVSADGPLGLPVEDHYDLSDARALCREKTAGISMFGVLRRLRPELEVSFGLLRATVEHVRDRGFSDAIAVINAEIEPLLGRFGLRRVGDPFFCPRVGQPLICMHGRIEDAPALRPMGSMPVAVPSILPAPTGLQLFNDYLACRIVYTLGRLGFFERLGERGRFEVGRLAGVMGVDAGLLAALVEYLRTRHLVVRCGDGYRIDPGVLETLSREYGFIRWLVGAYEPVLSGLEDLLRGGARYGRDLRRDDREVAHASAAISRHYTDPHMFELLEIDGLRTVVDIGTGSALRLIDICARFPHLKGIGLDISPDCCAVARENVRASGLEHRITIVEGRAEEWLAHTAGEGAGPVDMVLCFAMFHDLLNQEGLAERFLARVIEGLRPGAWIMIQDQLRPGEASRPAGERGPDAQMGVEESWGAGFELVHHVMGQRLFPRERYEQVFTRAGLRIRRRVATPIPDNWIYLLQVMPPADERNEAC